MVRRRGARRLIEDGEVSTNVGGKTYIGLYTLQSDGELIVQYRFWSESIDARGSGQPKVLAEFVLDQLIRDHQGEPGAE
jgi:hypothetical protein